MAFQPRGDERTLRDELQAAPPDVVERAGSEAAPDPEAFNRRVDLGVDEHDALTGEVVLGHTDDAPVEPRLVAMLGWVVDDLQRLGGVGHIAMMPDVIP